jgi:hypothetical protein
VEQGGLGQRREQVGLLQERGEHRAQLLAVGPGLQRWPQTRGPQHRGQRGRPVRQRGRVGLRRSPRTKG